MSADSSWPDVKLWQSPTLDYVGIQTFKVAPLLMTFLNFLAVVTQNRGPNSPKYIYFGNFHIAGGSSICYLRFQS